MKACRGSRSTVPLIFSLGTGWGWFATNSERSTDMRRLTTGYVPRNASLGDRRCANVIECTYTNLDSIAYYTPRLYGIAYCS